MAAVVVSQVTEYGAVASSAPRLAPFNLNWTPTTATLSVAVAATEIALETVAPFAGVERLTLGGVVSGAAVTVTLTAELAVIAELLSVASAVNATDPIAVGVQAHEYGAVVSVQSVVPFALNTTWLTVPSLSPAVAVTVMVEPAVNDAPLAGAVIDAVGGAFAPPLVTVTLTGWPIISPLTVSVDSDDRFTDPVAVGVHEQE